MTWHDKSGQSDHLAR